MNGRTEGVLAVVVAPPQEVKVEAFCSICHTQVNIKLSDRVPSVITRAFEIRVAPCTNPLCKGDRRK